jgi:hypothetical protein
VTHAREQPAAPGDLIRKGAEDGWLVQQAQYDLAQVRRDRIKLKRLALV